MMGHLVVQIASMRIFFVYSAIDQCDGISDSGNGKCGGLLDSVNCKYAEIFDGVNCRHDRNILYFKLQA